MNYRVEALMAARLFVVPQFAQGRIYFLSNLSGSLSLYSMLYGGSVPEPLLPPHIALQNPLLIGGYSFCAFPELDKILVMVDRNGDENYQPMLIPLEGGFPEPAFDNFFAAYRTHLIEFDPETGIVYLLAERRDKAIEETYRGDLKRGRLTKIAESEWGLLPADHSKNHSQLLLQTGYSLGDDVLFLWSKGKQKLLLGKPLEERTEGERIPLNGIKTAAFAPGERGAIVLSAVFEDTFGLGYIEFRTPGRLLPIKLKGAIHRGVGEMVDLKHLKDNRYLLTFNIDGCSWAYEGFFDEKKLRMDLKHVVVGPAPLDNGVLSQIRYDKAADVFALSFSTTTSPTQIYTVGGKKRNHLSLHTHEKILGISEEVLSKGEDASFLSFDGLRTSARLYLPAKSLGFKGPRPLVYYVHGGPQSQERPDFAWFSMPLIQFLTLRGFAVFVPNVRGSTGYGLSYTKHIDRDWGGKDRLDHVHAITKVLAKDKRLDTKRVAVVGRSYGGYMTLMLAGLHPALWKAACDMFGPYDLLTFSERIPETWKPYFKIVLGDAAKPEDREFLIERSPKTHLHNMSAPMLVIQGRNDPRVVAAESEDLVNQLQTNGKELKLLIFEDEGHDVLKYENRITCYNAIVDIFAEHLNP